jgi:hypothetical protein
MFWIMSDVTRILIEGARGKAREHRGGDWQRVDEA